ncbi:hypothetical protein CHARACLAT_029249 [Characodon lateralis]|uniref:Uncharacterized protein n=1 Tax=Characodon lateralis TaxID=208331 RepID=A0ABU7EEB4_9TELE|nr:hypothetical protein [Characodon lateralis]
MHSLPLHLYLHPSCLSPLSLMKERVQNRGKDGEGEEEVEGVGLYKSSCLQPSCSQRNHAETEARKHKLRNLRRPPHRRPQSFTQQR